MAEQVESIVTLNRGGGFQLLEQGQPGDMFTEDVEVLKVTDPEANPAVHIVRITFGGDTLTLTFDPDKAQAVAAAMNTAATP